MHGSQDSDDTARLLQSVRDGDVDAAEALFPHVYAELRRLAAGHLGRERDGHTLSATALVHEAYLKLAGTAPEWQDRTHVMAVAARAMRQILTDHARARRAEKRGGSASAVTLDPDRHGMCADPAEDILALDEALDRLAAHAPDLARLVELRFFGGLSMDEAAEALGVSARTAARMWGRAKAYVRASLDPRDAT